MIHAVVSNVYYNYDYCIKFSEEATYIFGNKFYYIKLKMFYSIIFKYTKREKIINTMCL